jgi:hypothetical protein
MVGDLLCVGVFMVKLDMSLRGFDGMMFCMLVMSMSEVSVMGARFVIAVGDMGSGFAVMFGGLFVMFGGVFVMVGGVLGVRHGRLPFLPHLADGVQ